MTDTLPTRLCWDRTNLPEMSKLSRLHGMSMLARLHGMLLWWFRDSYAVGLWT